MSHEGVVQLPVQRQVSPGEQAVPRSVQPAPSRTWHRALVLLIDLVGVVLIVGAPGADRGARLSLAVPWCLLLAATGVPRFHDLGDRSRARSVLTAGACLVVAAAGASYGFALQLPRLHVLVLLPVAVLASAVARMLGDLRPPQRILLVGTPAAVVPVRALLRSRARQAVQPVGVCCPVLAQAPGAIGGVPVVGALDAVAAVARAGGVDAVLVCSEPETAGPVLRKIVWELEGSGVPVLVAPGIVELGPVRVRLSSVAGLTVLGITDPVRGGWAWSVKRALDLTVAAAALGLLTPLLVVIGVAVRCSSPGPAVFRQERVGQDGRRFTLLKFRTMHVDAEQRLSRVLSQNQHAVGPLFKIASDPRVTRVGRLLRRTSLDELPQLWNVLRGDMSLVGPRPPLPQEVATYCDAVSRRLLVPPGLSGLWQVSGRADLDWDESARLDLWYVENWSLTLDLSILRRTVGAVLQGRGAY